MAIPESGSLVLTLFDQLVDRVKSSQPIKTDGKSLTLGMVYSQLPIGMMVDPNEYRAPWSPMGGATLQDQAASKQPAAAGTGATDAAAASGPAASKPAQDPKFRRAMDAAFKTSQLVDKMLMVSKDNRYLEYPTERKVSFAYEGIISGMQSMPMPPMAPEIENQIKEAQKVLYELDDQGNIVGKSKLYKRYVKNATDYAMAKKQYADAQAKALADPVAAETFPQDSVFFQSQVDQAWDALKTEGAEKIERALSIIESVGVGIQNKMIAKARKVYDAWNLGLAGVPTTTPYSYVSPPNWSDPLDDSDGWTRLQITKKEYHSHAASSSTSAAAGGSLFLGFINTAAKGGYDRANNKFSNDSSGLTIDMEYGIVTINRPWCIGDLFYLKNWYLVNSPKNAISNGTLDGQDDCLLPMIPMQFLCVRNVKITAEQWKSDGEQISSKMDGSGGFSLGFLNFGARGGRGKSETDLAWSFDGSTLSINGTQIIAWLSEIVPACAPLDDPNLKPADKK